MRKVRIEVSDIVDKQRYVASVEINVHDVHGIKNMYNVDPLAEAYTQLNREIDIQTMSLDTFDEWCHDMTKEQLYDFIMNYRWQLETDKKYKIEIKDNILELNKTLYYAKH